MTHAAPSPDDARHLVRLPGLAAVDLSGIAITDDGVARLARLARLPRLRELRVAGCGVTEAVRVAFPAGVAVHVAA